MGSAFCTIDEAANRLGRHRRSIHNYINKGFLKRTVRDGKVLLDRDEVEQLAIELGTDFPSVTRRSFFALQAKVKKLEQQMALVEDVWGIQEKTLRPSQKEAEGMHKAATDYLLAAGWKYEELESWAALFNQFDETTLDSLASATTNAKPWEVFYSLASRMTQFAQTHKEYKTSLHLQALKTKLEMGRRKVREAALLWIEMGKGTVPAQVFRLLDTPQEDLLRRLTRPNGKN